MAKKRLTDPSVSEKTSGFADDDLMYGVDVSDTTEHPTGTSFKVKLINIYNYILAKLNLVFQTILVSGTNIKTINGDSVLGAGNIDTQTEYLPMPNNTVKGNISGATAVPTNIPVEEYIRGETALVSGTKTILDSRVTANTTVELTPSNTGTLTQQLRYTKNVGVSVVVTAGASDTCTFTYKIIF